MKKLLSLSFFVIFAVFVGAQEQPSAVSVASTTTITVPVSKPTPIADTVSSTSTTIAVAPVGDTVTSSPATSTPSTAKPVAVPPATSSPTSGNSVTSTPVGSPAQDSSFNFESDHYAVRSYVSVEHAQALAERLEAYQKIFNKNFHFDIDKSGLKMKVRVFASKQRFDSYLQKLINETRDDFVYLHYTEPGRSELIGYVDATKPAPEASIAHQSFIQFLRAYVPNPPLWLREGFAVYFEEISWDADKKVASLRENLSWLETYKDLAFGSRAKEAIPFEELLTMTVDKARAKIQIFYPQAWALVNYLSQSEVKNHNRILWDSIAVLTPSATLDDNSQAVIAKAFKWENGSTLNDAFASYFKEKKTYRELIQTGIDLYAAAKAKESEAAFQQALGLQDASFVPYYYLGLINYDKGSFAQAESYYQKALDKGASPALTNYAMGVNAFADNRFDVAKQFLKKTQDLDPTFKDKVADLVQRMDS